MDMWIFPVGAKVNDVELSEPTILPAQWVQIGDTQYEPGIFDRWTADELGALGFVKAPPPPIDERSVVLMQIAEMEAQQTPRRIREAALTEDGRAWLAGLDAQIAALRAQLAS